MEYKLCVLVVYNKTMFNNQQGILPANKSNLIKPRRQIMINLTKIKMISQHRPRMTCLLLVKSLRVEIRFLQLQPKWTKNLKKPIPKSKMMIMISQHLVQLYLETQMKQNLFKQMKVKQRRKQKLKKNWPNLMTMMQHLLLVHLHWLRRYKIKLKYCKMRNMMQIIQMQIKRN